MERVKISSRLEFPRYLNMEEYIEPELQKKKFEEIVTKLKAGTLFQEKDEEMEDSDDDDDHNDLTNREEEEEEPADGPPTGDHIYELFSILIHSGGVDSGHYYAYIKVTIIKYQIYEFSS